MFRAVYALLLLAAITPSALAAEWQAGEIMVGHAWARASAGKMARNGAAYITVHNLGSKADRLVAVETPAAAKAQFHTHVSKEGVMRMRRIKAVEVPPGAPVVFRPGGLHVMLMKLVAPLEKGGELALVLTFEKAGRVEITVPILAVGAMGGQHHDDMHKGGGHEHDKHHKMNHKEHHGGKTDS
ncbi:MAG: copper chaperone PCu(A)C [Alphaproteobacteria bacterium]|nr:copper chaperone PCu(A)C [Alphaproteobacteria bacterium]